jgi:peroxiredoxin
VHKIIRLAILLTVAAVISGHDFALRDTSGKTHSSGEWREHSAIVLFFITTDCPVGNSYVPEMNRIHDAYAARGVLVYAVNADATAGESDTAEYAKEYRYGFPLLLDPQQELVRLTGATMTPQAAVLSADGKLLYLGRIDNRVEDFGKQRLHATEFNLRDALDAVLSGKAVTHPRTKSIGCAINPVKQATK